MVRPDGMDFVVLEPLYAIAMFVALSALFGAILSVTSRGCRRASAPVPPGGSGLVQLAAFALFGTPVIVVLLALLGTWVLRTAFPRRQRCGRRRL